MFDAATDPLGIGVQQRAQQRRFQDALDGLHSNAAAPTMLPDPKWDGYFEAVNEAGDGKPTRFGYDAQTAPDLSRDPAHAFDAADIMPQPWGGGNTRSQQLGTPLDRAVRGIRGGL